jgi:hypothetical protein
MSELLLTLTGNLTATEIVTPQMLTVNAATRDQAGPPNFIVSNVHRVTDVGLGLAGDGVMEPVWAYDGIFTANDFEGTGWIRDIDFTLQAHVHNNVVLNPDTRLLYDVSVPAAYKSSSGLWLPPFDDTEYTGIVPWAVSTARTLLDAPIGTQLRDFQFLSSDAEIVDAATVEFVFQIVNNGGTIANDLYCARVVDATAADWYRHVEPWSLDIHDEVKQKGGVSILKNIINPDLGEVTTLHYTLAKAGTVTISVFDLAGDLVRVLARGSVTAGDHLQTWDGRNSTGRTVARGVYFIRIRGPGIDAVRKVLVIK